MRKSVVVCLVLLSMWSLPVTSARGSVWDDKSIVYVIRRATISQFGVEVRFGKDIPPDTDLTIADNWLIRTVSAGTVGQFHPASVTVAHPPTGSIATLNPGRALDPSTERITILLQIANFPEFTVGEADKRDTFTKAKGKDDADIYFSGSAVGARGSKPLYAFESKLGYLFDLGKIGSFGPRAAVNAASESNIDPDSIKATATYQKVFPFGPAGQGIILNSDALGVEFDTENRTRNLATELSGILVLPSARLGEGAFAAIDFMTGFEAGHNYRHKLNEDGLGNFWRWKFGATAYFIALHPPLFKRIDFNAEYKVRLLNSAEPFTKTINDQDVTTLKKGPRHYFGSDLDFMFSDLLGISLKYRYGSIPPAFKFVNHAVSIGLTFKIKQARK